MADVFIAYARDDKARVRPLASALQSHGWSVWWDDAIPGGIDYDVYIQQQLDDAACVLVVWSKTSVQSSHVRDEADEGLRNKKLVPVLLEDARPALGFRRIQTVDLTQWDGRPSHEAFVRLAQSIARIVPVKSGPQSPAVETPDDETLSKIREEMPKFLQRLKQDLTKLPHVRRIVFAKDRRSLRAGLFSTHLDYFESDFPSLMEALPVMEEAGLLRRVQGLGHTYDMSEAFVRSIRKGD